MDDKRFSEVISMIALAIVTKTTPQEREDLISRWHEAGRAMPAVLQIAAVLDGFAASASERIADAVIDKFMAAHPA